MSKRKILRSTPSQTMSELALGILRDQVEGKKYMGLPLTRTSRRKETRSNRRAMRPQVEEALVRDVTAMFEV